jgi:hypothetical protein
MHIHTSQDLENAIAELERKKVIQEKILTEQFHATVNHFKPGNLIKDAFRKVIEPGDTRSNILKTAGGLGAGLLAKNLIFGKATSIIGKLASNAIKVGATNSVLHNSDKIAAWGSAIYNNLFKKKNSL